MLRAVMHHPVAAGDQELRRHGDGARIGDDALGGLVEPEQDVDRDRPRDQRIGIVGGDARGIVGQEFRLDVGIDEEIAAQLLHQRQAGPRERHVELHLEGGRGEHHGAELRRVIVHPGRRPAPRRRSARRPPCPRLRCRGRPRCGRRSSARRAPTRRSSGVKPRSPGERPWPRASQAKNTKSRRSSSSTTCAMRPECSCPRWKRRTAPRGLAESVGQNR